MIYLDYNSTAPVRSAAVHAMYPYLTDGFYNPSSPYHEAKRIAEDMEEAREFFAKSINAASKDEIYFVSCGSEANNWAIQCSETHNYCVITDVIEHHSVLNSAKCHEYYCAGVNHQTGIIEPTNVQTTLEYAKNRNPNYNFLISTMWINNELGTIQPIKEIGQLAHKYGAAFHVDAVQAYCKIPIDVQKNNIDMLSISSHKIGAPRGSGFLYIREGTPIYPLIIGGQQERHMRAGTENVAGIMAFKAAAVLALKNLEGKTKALQIYHDAFVQKLSEIDNVIINNKDMNIYPNVISINCGVPAERMVAFLDEHDIKCSSGSACNSKSNEPSHVLKAIGLSDDEANNTIRLSFGTDVEYASIDYVCDVIKKGTELLK